MKKSFDYLNITLSILTITLLGAFALRPTLITALQMRKDINDYEELRNKLQVKLIHLGELQRLIKNSQDDLLILDELIPNSPKEEDLLKATNNSALLNNVKLTKIAYAFNGTETNPKSLTINISAEGGYKNLIAFMNDISNDSRILEITNIELTNNFDKATKNSIVKLRLIGIAYYSLENQND